MLLKTQGVVTSVYIPLVTALAVVKMKSKIERLLRQGSKGQEAFQLAHQGVKV